MGGRTIGHGPLPTAAARVKPTVLRGRSPWRHSEARGRQVRYQARALPDQRPYEDAPRLPEGGQVDLRSVVRAEWLEIEIGPGRGWFLVERAQNRVEMVANGPGRDTRRQAYEDAKQRRYVQIDQRIHHGRHEDFCFRAWLGSGETFPGNACDVENFAAHAVFARDGDPASHYLWIAFEAMRPVIVRKDCNGMGPRV